MAGGRILVVGDQENMCWVLRPRSGQRFPRYGCQDPELISAAMAGLRVWTTSLSRGLAFSGTCSAEQPALAWHSPCSGVGLQAATTRLLKQERAQWQRS